MTRFDDLDRAIDAYFELETTAAEPAELLDDVRAATIHRRPRSTWSARLRHLRIPALAGAGAGARPNARLAIFLVVGGLLLAVLGAVLVTSGSRPPLPGLAEATPSPSPTGAMALPPGEPWIAYMSNVASADSDRIWLVRPDASDRHQVDPGIDATQQEHPDWSPDGTRLAFDRWRADDADSSLDRIDLWTMAPDGSDARLLAACEAPCLQLANPAWSRDGRSIAHVRYGVASDGTWGPSAIEVTDVTTGTRTTVIESRGGEVAYYDPRWSADGRSIVFGLETYTDASESTLVSAVIAVIAVDPPAGTEPRIVTPAGLDAWGPDWHPTEERILFNTRFDPADAASRETATDIYEIRPDGTGLTNITDLGLGDLRAIEPTWTPDGRRIVFTQVDGFGGGQIAAIALMDADGGNVSRLGFAAGSAGRMRPTP
ncbi:MAG TPA: hypothetical protein VF119_01890 [Candidatus Limnocylindrales bacterium]